MTNTENLTSYMNNMNIDNVRKQIALKKSDVPFYATIADARSVITDFDHFPYTRYFRGVYNQSEPIVMNREAGWRPTQDQCYQPLYVSKPNPYPNNVFETACSTTYPSRPEFLSKYSDRDALLLQLNNECILEYR
jgi:hypothetical protein